jgi:hypothetical protein
MHKDRETPAFQPQQLFHTVNIQQSSIEAAALISETPEATILNCDSPLPCRFCSH